MPLHWTRLNRIVSCRVRSRLVKSCPVYASQGYYESNYFYIESRRVVSRSVSSGRGRSSQGIYNENGKGKIMNESMLLLISGYSEREFLFVLIVGIIGVCLYFNG